VNTFLNVLLSGLLLGGIYALVSLGLNLIFGVVRIVNFAQGEFIMIAMYATYACFFFFGMSPYVAIFIVAPGMFLFGIIVQRLLLQPLRDEPLMQVFTTFGLLILMQNVVLAITRGEGKSVAVAASRTVIDLGIMKANAGRVIIFVVTAAIAGALLAFLRYSHAGKVIRAVIQDRDAARLMGINVELTYLLVFGLGAALAGVAGSLLAPIYTLQPQIGGNFILAAFAVVVLGGMGSVAGAYFGGLAVGIVESFAGYYVDPALKQAIWFLIFIAVLVVRPSGLFGRKGTEEIGLRQH
jgi:branched-chain amino acid transport system permease protein